MCGIAGRVNFTSRAPVDRRIVQSMCDLLAHRGPDGDGVLVEGHVGFGHRRLAIIDTSAAGRQPMTASGKRLWITFNGEIYNYRELRHILEQRGHVFETRTDTEVILAAYLEFGIECLDRLRGMFAFAIWDNQEQQLLLARDRAGKKPLHYYLDAHGIAFASEPKAFFADPAFEARPNLDAISEYLTYQYVPSPLSAFQGVQKLRPATFLIIKNGAVREKQYWKLQYGRKRDLTEEAACEELLERLRESVRMRMISDVPLGAFLSGGIDSSAVVALMAGESSSPVQTFSIGFEETDYDELSYARLVAARYHTLHREFVVRPDAVSVLPRLAWHYNEPYADESAIPTYHLSELTRRYVTVALNGDAGDENFAGYRRYVPDPALVSYDRIPQVLRWPAEWLGHALPRRGRPDSFAARAGRWLRHASQSSERRYVRHLIHFDEALKDDLCTPEFLAASDRNPVDRLMRAYGESDAPDFVDAMLDLDVNHYLPDCLLVKVDIATMAHGLEGRSPFLDHPLMEFAASLPSSMKLRGTTTKYLLKRAVRDLLPNQIIDRPKMGFGVPLGRWFRGELREMASDLLLSQRIAERGYFRPAAVRQLLDEHLSGRVSRQHQLFNLLMLELWHQIFIDRRPAGPPSWNLEAALTEH